MRNIKEIISHIKQQPYYKFLIQKSEFFEIISQKQKFHILFFYLKNSKNLEDHPKDTMMIAVRHPASKKELMMQVSDFRSYVEILNLKYKTDSYFIDVKNFVFFIPNKILSKKNEITSKIIESSYTPPPLIEPAMGEFKNNFKDRKMHKIFEEIRSMVIANR